MFYKIDYIAGFKLLTVKSILCHWAILEFGIVRKPESNMYTF